MNRYLAYNKFKNCTTPANSNICQKVSILKIIEQQIVYCAWDNVQAFGNFEELCQGKPFDRKSFHW